ncbi:hypothetical protein BC830DRAFT_1093849 [Chytriomyces sp. MP71]|nr:hypothetical protein BC830DRAFT_1093849 [Chytriomyces sp. MP71]
MLCGMLWRVTTDPSPNTQTRRGPMLLLETTHHRNGGHARMPRGADRAFLGRRLGRDLYVSPNNFLSATLSLPRHTHTARPNPQPLPNTLDDPLYEFTVDARTGAWTPCNVYRTHEGGFRVFSSAAEVAAAAADCEAWALVIRERGYADVRQAGVRVLSHGHSAGDLRVESK